MGHLCTCWVRASWAILGGAASLFSFFLPLALSLISLSENCACGSCSHSSFPLLVLSLFFVLRPFSYFFFLLYSASWSHAASPLPLLLPLALPLASFFSFFLGFLPLALLFSCCASSCSSFFLLALPPALLPLVPLFFLLLFL